MSFEYSELSRKQKKKIYIFIAIFIIGFVLLNLVGEKINVDGFVIIGFIAPLSILIGVIGIAWTLYHHKDDDSKPKQP